MRNVANVLIMLAASLVSAKVPQATDSAVAGGNSTGYTGCDALFKAGLGRRVLLATNPAYEPRIQSWWTWNTRQHPWCLFQPLSASEVSTGLTALLGTGNGAGDWHIAVRSGGHSFGFSNNIDQGVTIDLGHLNHTTYDEKAKLASVGTGAKWWTVYAALQKHNVVVTGGRDGDVGVGGFTLGGGSSFFMNREGFACDSVKNYEVVLANGTIVNANKDKNILTAKAEEYAASIGGSNQLVYMNYASPAQDSLKSYGKKNVEFIRRVAKKYDPLGAFQDRIIGGFKVSNVDL